MKENKCYWGRRLCLIFIFILLMCSLPIQSVAEHREYDDEKFQEKLIIPASSLKTIDLEFNEGEELEFIFGLQVKEGLPIDVWFVNDENYNKFVGGGEFSYFIDGSEKNVIVDAKIVGVKEYNSYKLILANYNNQTIEVDIIFETRIYRSESNEDELTISDLAFPLLITVIILAALLILLFIKTRRLRQAEPEVKNKTASRKSKNRKTSKKSRPPKREAKPSKKGKSQQKSKSKTVSQKSKSKLASDSITFCGFCGKPVDTPFCKNCGHEA